MKKEEIIEKVKELANEGNVEKAKLNTKRVKSEKDTKEQELIDAFVIDYNNMILAKEKLINLKQNLELSLELFESYKRLFIAGKKQWLDLVNSSKEIMDISVSYRDTKELYTILKYKIALQTGQINLEGLSNNNAYLNIKLIDLLSQIRVQRVINYLEITDLDLSAVIVEKNSFQSNNTNYFEENKNISNSVLNKKQLEIKYIKG